MQPGIYLFKEEFCKSLGIPANQYDRKKKELLEWLTNFYDYEILKGNPIRIKVNNVLGTYQTLPRKLPKQSELSLEKIKDYTEFTKQALGEEFKPNSKMLIARQAINSFGETKYGHTNPEGVAKRYIKQPFEEYGETDGSHIWVFYSNYEPLDDKALEIWATIRREEHISDLEAANAFYKQAEGEDISKELTYYQIALKRFKEIYVDTPICVAKWRLKKNG